MYENVLNMELDMHMQAGCEPWLLLTHLSKKTQIGQHHKCINVLVITWHAHTGCSHVCHCIFSILQPVNMCTCSQENNRISPQTSIFSLLYVFIVLSTHMSIATTRSECTYVHSFCRKVSLWWHCYRPTVCVLASRPQHSSNFKSFLSPSLYLPPPAKD